MARFGVSKTSPHFCYSACGHYSATGSDSGPRRAHQGRLSTRLRTKCLLSTQAGSRNQIPETGLGAGNQGTRQGDPGDQKTVRAGRFPARQAGGSKTGESPRIGAKQKTLRTLLRAGPDRRSAQQADRRARTPAQANSGIKAALCCAVDHRGLIWRGRLPQNFKACLCSRLSMECWRNSVPGISLR